MDILSGPEFDQDENPWKADILTWLAIIAIALLYIWFKDDAQSFISKIFSKL